MYTEDYTDQTDRLVRQGRTTAFQRVGRTYQEARFWGFHVVAVLGSIWAGVTWEAAVVCVVLYWVRMFGSTGCYHRYFSHRTYKTSRAFQFVLAFLAQTNAQQGVIWWARNHRHHHRYSDQPEDLHSPVTRSLFESHVGWISNPENEIPHNTVADLERFPELRFLDRHWLVPPTLLAVAVLLLFGWSGLFFGFFVSTVLVWHCTFTINSLAHIFGSRRYDTPDESRNNWFLAIITMGEGWHNNHHHYMRSVRQGFYWWEIDLTWYILVALSWVGLVWDLKDPPAEVYDTEQQRRSA